MYRLSVYYNSDPYAISAVDLACVVDRLATTTNGALFRILNNGYTVVVNDYSCLSDCNVTVPIGGRFTIVLSTEFKFFIEVVDDSNTLVYVDNNNCNQDLSDLCKGGLSKPDAWLYGCLCEGDRECSAPMPFDSCPSPGTSNMFTVFSSSSPSSKKEKLATIVRYPVYPFGANYYFYPETAHVITLSIYGNDGPCKPTNCSEFVTNKNILDIVIDGSIQLFVQESDTSWDVGIGKGDDNCQQNIENTCKIGKTGSEDSEYTCLCEGSKSDCFAPDYFDNCGMQDGTTVSTTTENPNSFSVSAYYGVSPDTAELAVYIERTAVSPYFAFFSIYQMSTVPVQVDGTQCNKNCTHQIKTNDRLDITMNGYMHFYIYQQHNDSIVGIGDGRCDQDLSQNCKAGNSLNNGPYMTCLCEIANACTDPDPFDSCQANPVTPSSSSTTTTTTTTTTARPTIATMSTPTSKTDSPGDTSTTDGAVELTSPLSTSFVIMTTTSPVPSLEDLNNTPITSDNVGTVLNQTLKYSEQKCQLNSTDVDLISSILYKSANVSGLDQTDSLSILVNMDFVLFAPRTSISDDAATNFTSLLPTMVQNTNSSTIDYLTGTNIGFSAKQVNCSDPSSYQGLMDEWTKFVKINGTPEDRRNAITVPLQQICATSNPSHVFFSLYRDHKFFQGPKIYRRYDNHVYNDNKNQQTTAPESNSRVKRDVEVTPRELPPSPCDDQQSLAAHSPIMSATVLQNTDSSGSKRKKRSTTDQSNEPMVHMQFNVSGLLSPLHGRFVVTWFNTTTREWATTNQCSTKREGDVVVATCNHLTDFTLIVSASLYDGSVCDIGLQTTGYVVNALSIVSLTFLFIIYICAFIPTFADTKAMRYVSGCATAKRDSISLSYTTALLLFYLTFTIFSQEEISGNACTTMGAIAYALFISTIVINIFKCIRMTLRFVPSPTRDFFQFMQRTLVFDTISIIVPFVISIILLLLTDFFNRNDAFCWVRMDYVVFATVVPISILVFNAVITSSLVAYRLFSSNMRVKKRGRHIDYNLGAKLANLLVLQFTLGMPWLLQYFTLAMPTVGVWHYLFTIVLGSQGTVLVLLFFYKRQRILRSSRHAKKLASQHTQATIVSDGSNSNS